MGKALYRRYRSRSLSEVIGQGHITGVLEKSLKSGKISHAYLFVGPRGTGKTSVARILAHEINGFDYELEDDYLDIIEIDAASNTGVDNIRELRERAIIAPTKGKYKVYIIDEVHMLSKSAFNALLKTLEEPPEHVVFIMATTDAHKVPVTITSRSQSFVFRLADADTMFAHLRGIADKEGIRITDGALKIVGRRSGGSFRDAISLLDQVSNLAEGEISEEVIVRALGLPQDDLVQQLYESYLNGNSDAVVGYLRELVELGVRAEVVAEELMGRIVENPYPEAMGLLERLPEVPRAAYPEVRLLLALAVGTSATGGFVAGASTVGGVAAGTSVAEGLVAGTSAVGFSENGAGASPSLRVAATSSLPLSSQRAKSPQTPPAEGQGLNWSDLLVAVKEEAPGITRYVEDSDYEIVKGKLTIYAKKPFAKTQIDKKRDFILSRLPEGVELEVRAEAKNVDAMIASIAEIMGGGEEVAL